MLQTIESEIINRYLVGFGRNLHGQPLFRLVWTSDLTEMRNGEYNEFHGDIFVRRTVGTVRVPKYNYLMDRWIIERWLPPEQAYHSDLPDSKSGGYQVIYVFEANGQPLPLNLRVVQILMQGVMEAQKSSLARKTQIKAEMEKTEREFERKDEEIINEDSVLLTQLHWKDSVLNIGHPDNEPKEKK